MQIQSQDEDDENHEGQNAQMHAANQQQCHLAQALEIQWTKLLDSSIQSGYASLDQQQESHLKHEIDLQ